MIDPIRNPAYQDYQTKKLSQKVPGTNTEKEKFNLDYADEGVLYEPSSEEDEKADQAAKKQAGSFQAAAALELRELTEENAAPANRPAPAAPSLTDTLRSFFARARQFLKQLWSAIWESHPADPPAEEDAAVLTKDESDAALSPDAETSDTPESFAAENAISAADGETNTKAAAQDRLDAENDDRILHALKSGDRQNFRSLLSEDGRRIPARNSSLLTYYDSKGNLISPDASVQQRVLHGDRGSMKR